MKKTFQNSNQFNDIDVDDTEKTNEISTYRRMLLPNENMIFLQYLFLKLIACINLG